MDTIEILNEFWNKFCTSALYDTGYGDTVTSCGAKGAETREDVIVALAFIAGSAQTARVACLYMGRHWQVNNLIGIAAGVLLSHVRSVEGLPAEKAQRLCDGYERELRDLLTLNEDGTRTAQAAS